MPNQVIERKPNGQFAKEVSGNLGGNSERTAFRPRSPFRQHRMIVASCLNDVFCNLFNRFAPNLTATQAGPPP